MQTNIGKTDSTYVRNILSSRVSGWWNTRIFVPKYQRQFSWDSKIKQKHVDQLFDDFVEHSQESNLNNSSFAYYLGALVFVQSVKNNNEHRIDILDGQQRLTTLYLFCAALIRNFNVLINEINSSGIEDIQKRLFKHEIEAKITILKDHLITQGNETILRLGYQDDIEHFEYCLTTFGNNTLSANLRKSHPILKAFNLLDEKILEQLGNLNANNEQELYTEKKEKLNMLSEYMIGESCEITFTTIRQGQEFTIFQTLNNRGKDLNIYDLTRNIMIQLEANNTEFSFRTEEKFDNEIKKNTNPNGNFNQKNAENIILNNWNMQFSKKITTSKYMLAFDDFQKKKASEGGFRRGPRARENFEKFLSTLVKSSYAFAEIKDPLILRTPTDEFGSSAEKLNLSNQLTLLNITNLKQFYALYFALRHHNHKCDIVINYIKLVEKTYVNLLLLAEQSPAKIESVFSSFAYEIYNKSEDIYDLYRKHKSTIKSLIDEISLDFLDAFNKKQVSNNQSKYLLCSIQRKLSGNTVQLESLQLEHILPKKWNDKWKDIVFKQNKKVQEIDSETIESYVSMIGNHTILVNLTNNLVTNDVYDKKLIEYKKETIQITKGNDDISVTNYDEWNANSIESRQKALGKHAEEIWSM